MILGIGTDLAEIPRVEQLWNENRAGLERRVFTDGEVAYCMARARPAEHLAARFAAKEAALKALGTGWGRGVGLCDVEVVKGESGPPTLLFTGRALEVADSLGVTKSWLSMSHTDNLAIATVVLEGEPKTGGSDA